MNRDTNVYYNEGTNEIYIDGNGRTQVINLPKDVSATEVAYVLHSDVLLAIVEQMNRRD